MFKKIRAWFEKRKQRKLALARLDYLQAKGREQGLREVLQHQKDFLVRLRTGLGSEYGLTAKEINSLEHDPGLHKVDLDFTALRERTKDILLRFEPQDAGIITARICVIAEYKGFTRGGMSLERIEHDLLKTQKARILAIKRWRRAKGKTALPRNKHFKKMATHTEDTA